MSLVFEHTFEEVEFVKGLMFDVTAELRAIYEQEQWGSGWLVEDISFKTPTVGVNEDGEDIELNLSQEDVKRLEEYLLDLAKKDADKLCDRVVEYYRT